jgi:hypothetical protein
MLIRVITLVTLVWVVACQPTSTENTAPLNPPAEGFNLEASDAKAIELADQVMLAMGGRKAWDDTRYLKWNFFGARRHLWDKHGGTARIEDQRSDLKIIVNINEEPLSGKVYKNGEEFSNPDSINYYLDRGLRMWINDAYWLVMPYKLKDSGVTLTYEGKDTTQLGKNAEVIRLTFDQVGVTPQNAYDVWVTAADSLVAQWAYYRNATDSLPAFTGEWSNYQQKGDILLSGDRGNRKLTEIEVLNTVPEGVFENFEVSF